MMVSKKARKQRRERIFKPLHKRRKEMAARLSAELRKKWKKRSVPVRKGDKVKIITGDYKGKTGKVTKVDLRAYRINVEGIVRKKANGQEVAIPIHPSNVMIIDLEMSDAERKKILER